MPITPTPFRAPQSPFSGLTYAGPGAPVSARRNVDIGGPEPNWPKWFLVTHAMELTIKAYIVSREYANVTALAGLTATCSDMAYWNLMH
jgi:hypothetical protein